MSQTQKTVTVERSAAVGVLTCDALGCTAEQVDDRYGPPAERYSRAAWFRLTKGAGAMAACTIVLDACSPACLLKIVQSPEVTS